MRTITISLSIVVNTNSHVKKTHSNAQQKIPFLCESLFTVLFKGNFTLLVLKIVFFIIIIRILFKNTESNSHSVLFPGAVQNYQIYVDNYSYNKNN
jgi:hypothetical protein